MGTRADFYVGRGEAAEWIGSVAYDGCPEGFGKHLFKPTTEAKWRKAVAKELASRDDATQIENGWPWPWEDSCTTDYAYAFDDGKVYAAGFGGGWFDPQNPETDTEENHANKCAVFPNMKNRQNVTLGPRSGLLIIGG